MKKLFFLGGGGHFKEVFNWYLDQLQSTGASNKLVGIIDDDKIEMNVEPTSKLKIYSSDSIKYEENIYLVLAIGQISLRKKVTSQFKEFNFETCIHPSANISINVSYKKGNLFGPNCIISGDAKIGEFNNFSPNSIASMTVLLEIIMFFPPLLQLWVIARLETIIFLELVPQ